MTGFVYAIGDDVGRVKIGWSRDPCRRLTKVRSDCASPVTLLGIVPASRAQETEAHSLLRPWRVAGEWYRNEGVVSVFVAMLHSPGPRPITIDGAWLPLRKRRRSLGKTVGWLVDELAKRGVFTTRATVSRMETGKLPISPKMLPHLQELVGLPPEEGRPDLARLLKSEERA